MQKTIPSSISGPSAGLAEVRDLRVLVHVAADPVPHERADHREAVALDPLLDGVRDVSEPLAGPAVLDPLLERLPRRPQQLRRRPG